jgi:hypothetical protein
MNQTSLKERPMIARCFAKVQSAVNPDRSMICTKPPVWKGAILGDSRQLSTVASCEAHASALVIALKI